MKTRNTIFLAMRSEGWNLTSERMYYENHVLIMEFEKISFGELNKIKIVIEEY